MTREEIINGLQFTIDMFLFNPNTGEIYTEPRNDMDKTTVDACKGAIELLEQESILDKIKAEIEDTGAYEQEVNGKTEFLRGITYCLNIIDKYKGESEG